jgi:pyrrolidone-carboxylate peptidase
MSSLASFSRTDLPLQTGALAYGVKSSDLFRVTSSFNVTSETPAYAMIKGTVLIQQQVSNANKVNLILRPHDQKEFKLPIKYIIYRGLQITDFILNNNLSDPLNKVKTSGSELLVAMQLIQQGRAPGDDIPLEALFGNELSPANTKNIDEFFFKNVAPSSQLFTVECGVELGKFITGEIGIEIILENPELTVNVELAKREKYEINVSGITDLAQKKWQKDLVRHFADPAAYFGLHYDIKNGIEYRNSGGNKLIANTSTLVYNNVLAPYANTTRNTVYLDIRNENGYSYNYYNNYIGTGTDAEKELKIGQTSATASPKEYYIDGWAIHIVDIISPSSTTNENEFFIALRTGDNPRPLLASWNIEPSTYKIADPPITNPSNSRVFFTDETTLLTTTPSEFTNSISFKIPNISSLSKQLATIVKLNYIKQSIPVNSSLTFPRAKFTDYLFGPLETTIPWDTDNKIQWFSSNHKTYVDALNDGYILGKYKTTILSIDITTKEIEIFDEVPVYISEKVNIENDNSNTVNDGKYTPLSISYVNGKTKIKVLESIPSVLQTGDKLTLAVKLDGEMDYTNNKFLIDNNKANLEVLNTGNKLNFYSHYSFSNSFEIDSSSYNSADNKTEITFTNPRPKTGFAGFIETGHIIDIDNTTVDNDRIIFYASVANFFSNNGLTNLSSFNAKGGILNFDSILNLIPNVTINRTNLKISSSENILSLSYSFKDKSKEALFMLGITKTEYENAKNSANSILSQNHIKLYKLINEGASKTDLNKVSYYKYELIIAGLNSTGVYQEVNTGINIYTVDHLIFSSKDFGEKYKLDVTEAENALNEFIRETLGVDLNDGEGQGSGDGVTLSRFAYISNEEKFNLKKGRFGVPSGGGEANKKLFGLDPTMKVKVTQFKDALDTVPNSYSDIENVLKTKGADLLLHAKTRIKEIGNQKNKDGIIYLTRLIMQVVLKNHPKILSEFPTKIIEFSDLFEKCTRGLDGIQKPNFSSTPLGVKKILISGFDPFSGNFDGDNFYSNSSGNLAMALDGEVFNGIIVKSVLFPVRFREFDENWVENFFKPYLSLSNGDIKKPDMIITFSFSAKYKDFQFDRFASSFRGDNGDNEGYIPIQENINIKDPLYEDDDTFIINTLPFDKLKNSLGKLRIPNLASVTPTVGVNHRAFWAVKAKNNITNKVEYVTSKYAQKYAGFYSSKPGVLPPFDNYYLKITKINPSDEHQVSDDVKFYTIGNADYINFPDWVHYSDSGSWVNEYTDFKVESRKGSGADFLSNEIHYRVSYLRKKYSPSTPTGHIHINFMQSNQINDRDIMINSVKEIIKKLLE